MYIRVHITLNYINTSVNDNLVLIIVTTAVNAYILTFNSSGK